MLVRPRCRLSVSRMSCVKSMLYGQGTPFRRVMASITMSLLLTVCVPCLAGHRLTAQLPASKQCEPILPGWRLDRDRPRPNTTMITATRRPPRLRPVPRGRLQRTSKPEPDCEPADAAPTTASSPTCVRAAKNVWPNARAASKPDAGSSNARTAGSTASAACWFDGRRSPNTTWPCSSSPVA